LSPSFKTLNCNTFVSKISAQNNLGLGGWGQETRERLLAGVGAFPDPANGGERGAPGPAGGVGSERGGVGRENARSGHDLVNGANFVRVTILL
jgi:hypothetical protein